MHRSLNHLRSSQVKRLAGTYVWLLVVTAQAAPTRASLRKAFEANKAALVRVVGPHHAGPGVMVGESGEVLTSVDYVGLEQAAVQINDRRVAAKVLVANAELKVAVIAIDPPGHFAASAVREDDALETGEWLVGVDLDRHGEPRPVAMQISKSASENSPFFEADVVLSPGTPLFNSQGKLVALTVSRGHGGIRGLSLSWVKLQLSSQATDR